LITVQSIAYLTYMLIVDRCLFLFFVAADTG